MRVLVVDDSRVVRTGLAELIGDLEFVDQIDEAYDGVEALAAAVRTPPQVVLLDLRMPRLDGLEVLRRLKRSGSSPGSPPVVIVLTNQPTAAYRERCLAAGATDFLDKAHDFERIPALLRDLHASLG
jgi:CheY-like chemotaxis protein